MCLCVVRLFAFLLSKSIVLFDVLASNILHHLIGNQNGQGDLHDDNPLGPGQWANVKDHWHWVNVQNEEMERHGESNSAYRKQNSLTIDNFR